MKILINAIGKFKNSPEKEIYHSYIKRIPWQVELRELESRKSLPSNKLKEAESKILLSSLPQNTKLIALDECGKNISSNELSKVLKQWQNDGYSNITFIIGGANGLSNEVRQEADLVVSFGKMTWPHMLIRPMLAEQIYRIYTIITGHPYHRN